MKNYLKSLLIAVMMFGLIACGGGSGGVPIPRGDVTLSDKTIQTTPNGAVVKSKDGITADKLSQIDRGLQQSFVDGQASGWMDNGVAYNFGRYQVNIPVEPCVPSPVQQLPSFLVRGDNYDGSVYDQYNSRGELPVGQQTDWNKYIPDGVGVIYAAELLLTLNTDGSTTNGQPTFYASYIVCPDDGTLQEGTRNGAEHNIAAHFDTEYFMLTQTHSILGHPILPKSGSGTGRSISAKPYVMSEPLAIPVR